MDDKKEDYWSFTDQANYDFMKLRYQSRTALLDEAIKKRKVLADSNPSDPYYHRYAVSAEVADMRSDLAHFMKKIEIMEANVETLDWIHQQVDILQGCYAHQKMLAEKCRIDYGVVDLMLRQVTKLTKELRDGSAKGSTGAVG